MNTYLNFISDEKIFEAIDVLYNTYIKSFSEKTLKDLNKNIIDPFKFQFDTEFLNGGNPAITLRNEMFRQSDKSISNSIGLFHQKILGSINGFTETPDLPCDIKKCDNTIFAEIKNKHNTMNVRSAAGVYEELEGLAKAFPKAICYLVEIISKGSSDVIWRQTINEKRMEHPRIRKISADKFYELATGEKGAFKRFCDCLPQITRDYMVQRQLPGNLGGAGRFDSYQELVNRARNVQTNVLAEIFFVAFSNYEEFNNLDHC